MLCLAIGDALGNTTESLLPSERRTLYGEIESYPVHPALGTAKGYPSDDTQLAYWTLEHLLQYGRVEPQQLAECFASRRIFGLGGSVKAALKRLRSGADWRTCGVPSAGNGALMRIAPVLYHALHGRPHMVFRDAILATVITHNDSMAIASSLAAVELLMKCCLRTDVPEREWWAHEFIASLKKHETAFDYTSRSPAYAEFRGSLWQFLERHLLEPHRMRGPLVEALDWHSGAFLLETVPTCLLILMRYAEDPVQAILRAVNDTKDNDTIAAIVGAFAGALHGKEFIPERWISHLAGRTREDDDGAVFRILLQVKQDLHCRSQQSS